MYEQKKKHTNYISRLIYDFDFDYANYIYARQVAIGYCDMGEGVGNNNNITEGVGDIWLRPPHDFFIIKMSVEMF